jgi:trk system potassium uptake protein TrkA
MKFCVIGVGRFGFQVATTLADNGMEVLAVDSNESIIASIRDRVTHAICMRIHDEEALRAIGIEDMNTVIVAMGENFAQSILVTALLKQKLNINNIIARAVSEIHKDILLLVGANRVVLPEQEMGVRLADMLSLRFNAVVRIGQNYAISEQTTPNRFVGKTLKSLDLQEHYGIQCLGRKTDNTVMQLDPDYVIQEHDLLLFAGAHKELERVANL